MRRSNTGHNIFWNKYNLEILGLVVMLIFVSCNEDPKFAEYPFHSQAIVYTNESALPMPKDLEVSTSCNDSYQNCQVEYVRSEAFTLQKHEDGAFLYFDDPDIDANFADYISDGTKFEILKESYKPEASVQLESCHKVCTTGTTDCWIDCTYWRYHFRVGGNNTATSYSLSEIEFRLIKDEKIVFYVHYIE